MKFHPKIAIVLSILLLIAIYWFDVFSGDDIRITSLYLIPILLITWHAGRTWGYLSAAISVVIIFSVDPSTNTFFDRHLSFYIENFGRLLSIFILIEMATNLHAAYDRERKLARTDGLTHLMNRHAFYAALEIEFARAKRHSQPFSLLYLDCDNFKQVNDTMGHRGGDQLLCLIAETMQKNVRKGDLVARLGGDEFAIFFPDTNDIAVATIADGLANKLKQAVSSKYPQIGFSIGIAVYLTPPSSQEEMVAYADQLMYKVKSAGKNGLLQQVYQGEAGLSR